jgi:hypothetical protein
MEGTPYAGRQRLTHGSVFATAKPSPWLEVIIAEWSGSVQTTTPLSELLMMQGGMAGLDDLLQVISSKGRRVYVTERPIDLRNLSEANTVFVLQLPDDSTAAGGRGGGLGERRIVKMYHFQCRNGQYHRLPDVEDDARLDSLDLPYHATAMPVILPDGSEKLVSGVVDPDYVSSYGNAIG